MSRHPESVSGRTFHRTEADQGRRSGALLDTLDTPDLNERDVDSANIVEGWLNQVQSSRAAETAGLSDQKAALDARTATWRPHSLPILESGPSLNKTHPRSSPLFVDESPLPSESCSRLSDDDAQLSEERDFAIANATTDQELVRGRSAASGLSHDDPFSKRPRRKTRQDRYASKTDGTSVKKPTRSGKKNKRHRARVLRSGRDVMNNFVADAVTTQRLTMKPNLTSGLFLNGRGATPADLTFNDDDVFASGWGESGTRTWTSGSRAKDQRRIGKDMQDDSDFFANAAHHGPRASKPLSPRRTRARSYSPVVFVGSDQPDTSMIGRTSPHTAEETEGSRQLHRSTARERIPEGRQMPAVTFERPSANPPYRSSSYDSLSVKAQSCNPISSRSICENLPPGSRSLDCAIQTNIFNGTELLDQSIEELHSLPGSRRAQSDMKQQGPRLPGYVDASIQTAEYRDIGTMVSFDSCSHGEQPASPLALGISVLPSPRGKSSLGVRPAGDPQLGSRSRINPSNYEICGQPVGSDAVAEPREIGPSSLACLQAGRDWRHIATEVPSAHEDSSQVGNGGIESPLDPAALRPYNPFVGRPTVQPYTSGTRTMTEHDRFGSGLGPFLRGFASQAVPIPTLYGVPSAYNIQPESHSPADFIDLEEPEEIHDFIARVESEVLGADLAYLGESSNKQTGGRTHFVDKDTIDSQLHNAELETDCDVGAEPALDNLIASRQGARHGPSREPHPTSRQLQCPSDRLPQSQTWQRPMARGGDELDMTRFWRPNIYR